MAALASDEAILAPSSYQRVLALPYVGRLVASMFLARSSSRMLSVAVVLFVLAVFKSAALAGLTVFLAILPGLLISPIAGALLDRFAKVWLVILDYSVTATGVFLLVALHALGLLSVPLLLVIVTVISLTNPLSATGLRSSLPSMVPRHMWDRINGIDSATQEFSSVLGPALAGVVAAIAGAPVAMLVCGAGFVVAAAAMLGIEVGGTRHAPSGSVWRQARDGAVYVWHNRTLRGIAVAISICNVGSLGLVIVALPVMVLHNLGGNDSGVGLLWACEGVMAFASGLTVGRLGTEGREVILVAVGILGCGLGVLCLITVSWAGAIVGMLVMGMAVGPLDLGMFSLRQRRTDRAWFGRAIAISMSANFSGAPIGSAIVGATLGWSLRGTILGGVVICGIAALLALRMIPRHADPAGHGAVPSRP